MRCLICLSAPLLFHAPLRAGFIGNNYAISINTDYSGSNLCGGTGNAYGSYGVVYTASCVFSGANGGSYNVTAKSYTPGFGVAEAYAHLSTTGASGYDVVDVEGTAYAFDTWTNTSSLPLTVTFTSVVEVPPGGGFSSTTNPLDPSVTYGVVVNCEGSASALPKGTPACTGSFTIAPGGSSPFYMGISAYVDADFVNYGYEDFSATSNYLGSATLTSVTVTNSNTGGSVSPSILESANGTFLTPAGYAASAPEPSTLALMILAVPVILLRRVRKTCR